MDIDGVCDDWFVMLQNYGPSPPPSKFQICVCACLVFRELGFVFLQDPDFHPLELTTLVSSVKCVEIWHFSPGAQNFVDFVGGCAFLGEC